MKNINYLGDTPKPLKNDKKTHKTLNLNIYLRNTPTPLKNHKNYT